MFLELSKNGAILLSDKDSVLLVLGSSTTSTKLFQKNLVVDAVSKLLACASKAL